MTMKIEKIILAIALAIPSSASVMAETLVLILDVSGSTPIVEPNFIRASMPVIAESIAKLPIGSNIEVMTVGDDKKTPLSLRFYVQRIKDKHGDLAANLAKSVPTMIAQYLNILRENPAKMQGESSLSTSLLDASKLCQKTKPCEVQFYTDGMEFQPKVIAWPREYKKPLPPIVGLDLSGMKITLYGVGQCSKSMESGCASSQARIAIEGHWQSWLKKYGADEISIRRL